MGAWVRGCVGGGWYDTTNSVITIIIITIIITTMTIIPHWIDRNINYTVMVGKNIDIAAQLLHTHTHTHTHTHMLVHHKV